MKTSAVISFPLLLLTLIQSAAAPSSMAPKIWMTAGPYVRWINPPANPPAWWAKRSDDWKMFTPQGEKQWSTVASHIAVLTTAGHSIEVSCLENRTTYAKSCTDLGLSNEQSLDQYFRYIKAHHLAFAFEIGLLTDTQITGSAINVACGQEAFGREASLRFVFQKIKDAGGEIDYIRMDEPFHYGTRSCHDSVANVAADLNRTINDIVRAYFPNVQIGDAEPTTGRPGDAETIGQWAEAYRAAVGRPLAFFHADAAWDAGPVISKRCRDRAGHA
jgi:hypothetical protein